MNKKIGYLFEGWEEALIWSCLQGYMGKIIVDDNENPMTAIINVGDFYFLAGKPNINLIKNISESKLLIPKDKSWEKLIEEFYGSKVQKTFRYAIKKEYNIFDKEKLNEYVKGLDRDMYPSWDAHDLRSVALAEKLGYHLDKPYVTYLLSK